MVQENYLAFSSLIHVSRRSHQESETNPSADTYWKECREKTNLTSSSGSHTASQSVAVERYHNYLNPALVGSSGEEPASVPLTAGLRWISGFQASFKILTIYDVRRLILTQWLNSNMDDILI
jgi:hypothetical protein